MEKRTFQQYLKAHIVNKGDANTEVTNTRIEPGGKYKISDKEYFEQFIPLYYRDVVSKSVTETLTEKQLSEGGPIALDFDFRYTYETTEKQYNKTHIEKIMNLYTRILHEKVYQFEEDVEFPIYVFEKKNVNRVKEKNMTKDGIHMIIGIQADREVQIMLRKYILEEIGSLLEDIPLTNTWEDVIDKGIAHGTTNWQLYGSCKPKHEKYGLKHIYNYVYGGGDSEDGKEFIETKVDTRLFKWPEDFPKLSVRYTDHPFFFLKNEMSLIVEEEKEKNKNLKEKKLAMRIRQSSSSSSLQNSTYFNINSKEDLDEAYEEFLQSLSQEEYYLREAAELTMILPEKYYGGGKYDAWIRVCFALKNTSQKLWIVWIAFCAKWRHFDYSNINGEVMQIWMDSQSQDGLTWRSIVYWAKEDNAEEYKRVHESHLDFYLNQSLKSISAMMVFKNEKNIGCGDTDVAKILYIMCRGNFVCASIEKNKWFRYHKHRWVEDDSGTSLRRMISEELRNLYRVKCDEFSSKLTDNSQAEETMKKNEALTNRVLDISMKLSQTTHKDHIMKEAREFFYDPNEKFYEKLDSNPKLLCFNNGVLDMEKRVFRKGRPDDYLSKCTNIDYKPLDRERDAQTIKEINEFMEKLFPMKSLREYCWRYLSTLIIGQSMDQVMHNFTGGGANGKSVFTDLLGYCFGEYYDGSVPISMITQERQKQGTAAPDIVALKGIRIGVMQEPSKNAVINDGAMKELVSGVEPIRGRPLYGIPISFVPQFKLIICSNNLPKVNTTDHGTWRRLKVVMFPSLFCDEPIKGDKDKPHQFKKDPSIQEKFPRWAPVLMAMIVEILFSCSDKEMGRLIPCKIVDTESKRYRDREDHVSEFVSERIVKEENGKIAKNALKNEFQNWYEGTYGRGGPSIKEVHEQLDKIIGKFNKSVGGWTGYKIRAPDDDDEEYNSDEDEYEEKIEL